MYPSTRHTKMLMVGPDSAGQSAILEQLELTETVTSSEAGCLVQTIEYDHANLTVWDMECQGAILNTWLWTQFFVGVQAIIFVVNSTAGDRRLYEASEGVKWIMSQAGSPAFQHGSLI